MEIYILIDVLAGVAAFVGWVLAEKGLLDNADYNRAIMLMIVIMLSNISGEIRELMHKGR